MEKVIFEFLKVKEAFNKVKLDVVSIKSDLLKLKKQKAENTNEMHLLEEVRKLKLKVENLEKNTGFTYLESIIGNSQSKKYHHGNCPYGKKINSKKIVQFDQKADARKLGYNPCICMK